MGEAQAADISVSRGRAERATEHPDGFAIETNDLSKKYASGTLAVNKLNLRVNRGEIFGFVGPNGAGKTTTMRMLVGLVAPTSGTVRVLGRRPGTPEHLARVGALIETPAFYPHLSGLDNLRLAARYAGLTDDAARRALTEVGLADRGDDRFRAYSLGMKQRLGVAVALLKDPDLLILDEPTNGLDPAGVADMRELLRAVGRGGRTVLLSSHILAEVEQICDRVAIINSGQLVAEGTPAELRASLGGTAVIIRADPLEAAVTCLQEHSGVVSVQVVDGMLQVNTEVTLTGELNRRLVQAGIEVSELRPVRHSLEEAFLKLTGLDGSVSLATTSGQQADGAQVVASVPEGV